MLLGSYLLDNCFYQSSWEFFIPWTTSSSKQLHLLLYYCYRNIISRPIVTQLSSHSHLVVCTINDISYHKILKALMFHFSSHFIFIDIYIRPTAEIAIYFMDITRGGGGYNSFQFLVCSFIYYCTKIIIFVTHQFNYILIS